jgi:hypothetical protein
LASTDLGSSATDFFISSSTGALRRIAHFKQCEGFVQRRLVRSQLQGAMNLGQGQILLPPLGRDAGQQRMGVGVRSAAR